jgi:hypothetical protein
MSTGKLVLSTALRDSAHALSRDIQGKLARTNHTTNTAYSRIYPLQTKQQAPDALMKWIHDIGVMSDLVYDGSKEQGGGKHWKEIEQRHHIHCHVTEPHSQWQNRAEGEIREIKKAVRH